MASTTDSPPLPSVAVDTSTHAITSRVYARIGLLGNPSDGFFGKTISFSLRNFSAEVTLTPKSGSTAVSIQPHPVHDASSFDSLEALVKRVEGEGYYGGVRLLLATCKQFHKYCGDHGIPLSPQGLELSYDTNIPRQAGLSGSSALVCAALNCLMQYYGVSRSIPQVERPGLVLSAEQELGITAGLQDRVIQVYGGMVYMDFSQPLMSSQGHGSYTPLNPDLLPPLWLIYCQNPSDSGKVHSRVKQRWLEGEEEVVEGMKQVAACAEEGRLALEQRDVAALARLMDQNFDLRRSMFGDAALGAVNLQMVEVARSVGAAAKFPGSGGAIVALCPRGEEQEQQLQEACRKHGFEIVRADVAPPITP